MSPRRPRSRQHWQGLQICWGVLGEVDTQLADTSYFSAANVQVCADNGITPMLAMKRKCHHPDVFERFAPDTPAPAVADAVTQMVHRLNTQAGRALYDLRKQTIETVFGIIRHWDFVSFRSEA